jgi:hypothetical protein
MIGSINSGGLAYAQTMAQDVLVSGVGKELSLPDFAALAQVCQMWQKMIQPEIEKRVLKEVMFGKDKWLSIPGVWAVSEEPALTEDQKKVIIAKLKGPCAFFNDKDSLEPHRFQNDKIKKVWQTQKLIFFPETINKEHRTINSQNKLFHFIKEVNDGTAFEFILGDEDDAFRNQLAPKSYRGWVTLDVVPGSRGATYDKKVSLLTDKEYRGLMPNEAVTSNLILNLGPSKEKQGYFFGREGKRWTFTATTELYEGSRVIVGAAAPSGPMVSDGYGDYYFLVGAAGVAEVS